MGGILREYHPASPQKWKRNVLLLCIVISSQLGLTFPNNISTADEIYFVFTDIKIFLTAPWYICCVFSVIFSFPYQLPTFKNTSNRSLSTTFVLQIAHSWAYLKAKTWLLGEALCKTRREANPCTELHIVPENCWFLQGWKPNSETVQWKSNQKQDFGTSTNWAALLASLTPQQMLILSKAIFYEFCNFFSYL